MRRRICVEDPGLLQLAAQRDQLGRQRLRLRGFGNLYSLRGERLGGCFGGDGGFQPGREQSAPALGRDQRANPSPRKSKSSARSRACCSRGARGRRKPRGRDVRARRAGTRRASRRKHSRFQSRSFLVARLRRWRLMSFALSSRQVRFEARHPAAQVLRFAPAARAPASRRRASASAAEVSASGARAVLGGRRRFRARGDARQFRLRGFTSLRPSASDLGACPPRTLGARGPHRARSPGSCIRGERSFGEAIRGVLRFGGGSVTSEAAEAAETATAEVAPRPSPRDARPTARLRARRLARASRASRRVASSARSPSSNAARVSTRSRARQRQLAL